MNPILDRLNARSALPQQQTPRPKAQSNNILAEAMQLKQALSGKNPQQMVESLLQSGKMTQAQFDSYVAQAKQLNSLLK